MKYGIDTRCQHLADDDQSVPNALYMTVYASKWQTKKGTQLMIHNTIMM